MRSYRLTDGRIVTAASDAAIESVYPGKWTFLEALQNPLEELKRNEVSQEDFWDRWTRAERINLDLAMQHDPTATNPAKRTAAEWRLRFNDLSSLPTIVLTRRKVQDFVRDAETATILAAGRADVILSKA